MLLLKRHADFIFQGLRFAITGASSYLLYVVLFFGLSYFFGELTSLVVAYTTAAVAHFVASKYFTFSKHSLEGLPSEAFRFAVLLCLTTAANWLTFYCLRRVFFLEVAIALFMGVAVSSALSFGVMRAWVFARE